MEFKVINVCALALFFLVINTAAMPRDSSIMKVEPVVQVHENSDVKDLKAETVSPEIIRNEVHVSGRVSCEYEEPTEDPVCQEHCFPKGYKYGLCTSGVCSCI